MEPTTKTVEHSCPECGVKFPVKLDKSIGWLKDEKVIDELIGMINCPKCEKLIGVPLIKLYERGVFVFR